MTVQTRPRKRQRTILRDEEEEKSINKSHTWDTAVSELIQRLHAIRSEAVALRDDHLKCAEEIHQKISTRNTAVKAASKVTPTQQAENDDTNIFAIGVRVDPQPPSYIPSRPAPIPPMRLLTESDPPEKIIHEQSVIARAQAINRKNAELARERLPKQPEAMRSKTYHDYLLDEATWLATDFREERKWKIQMAKKLAKAVAQHCAQRAQREARLRQEAELRTIRIARVMAKSVRKFWSQIGEIADFKRSLVEKEKAAEDMKTQLDELLETTEAYSSEIARNLRLNGRLVNSQIDQSIIKQVDSNEVNAHTSALEGPTRTHPSDSLRDDVQKETEDISLNHSSDNGDKEQHSMSEPSDDEANIDTEKPDDERTMIAAEAEEQKDPGEIHELEADAHMELEELLRAQGIDPSTYLNDRKPYLDRSGSQSSVTESDAESSVDEHLNDSNSIDIDEAEDKRDPQETKALAADANMDIDELLRSQGIDPAAYKADKTNYLSCSAGPSTNVEHSSDREQHDPPKPSNAKEISSAALPNGNRARFETDKATNTQEPDPPPANGSGQDETKGAPVVSGSNLAKHPMPRDDSERPSPELQMSPSKQNSEETANRKSLENGSPNPTPMAVEDATKSPESQALQESDAEVPTELLRGTLRPYQATGMEWLVSLYNQGLNGILADEMGLGKTIQTIALLAWLAINEGIWGPHLIVVPTSVMVNWEVEFKRWLPGFKILTYFGSIKERKMKRQGWTKPNTFHVCITSYTLAVQDAVILRRKKWVYLILDEAHNIKNFESQRWQTLLSFASERRLLLTGTPLQNSIMELWSLMHFLMPSLFTSHSKFKDWFSQPIAEAADNQGEHNAAKLEIVSNLHKVLRPFILRRLKSEVEKGLPPKFEHTIKCPLSKRQRHLYEDFISRSDIQETLESGDFFGVMNVLMQLRKVCNHPDLFEGRPIVSPFAMEGIFYPVPKLIVSVQENRYDSNVNLDLLALVSSEVRANLNGMTRSDCTAQISNLSVHSEISQQMLNICSSLDSDSSPIEGCNSEAYLRISSSRRARIRHQALVNSLRLRRQGLYEQDAFSAAAMTPTSLITAIRFNHDSQSFIPPSMSNLVWSLQKIAERAHESSERFVCCLTRVSAPMVEIRYVDDDARYADNRKHLQDLNRIISPYRTLFRSFEVRSQVAIPSTRLIQWDCGKLQVLDKLLRQLQGKQSRVLIFTQMTKMLDVLESFLNLHTYKYLRLDGTTKTDDRQRVVHRFNTDRRIFCMILTTRAGGIGLNLTGADSVVFYDTDYNPAIDNQAQDRAHRIGQTKPVHIFRLVSENTVEENVLRRANEKKSLESLVISKGQFTANTIRDRNSKIAIPGLEDDPDPSKSAVGVQKLLRTKFGRGEPELPRSDNTATPKLPAMAVGHVETAFGSISGQRNDTDNDEKGSSDQEANKSGDPEINVDDYQRVSDKILVAEDEREKLALDFAEQERLRGLAEFEETDPHEGELINPDKPSEKSQRDFEQLISSLQPIQRYALNVVERNERENHLSLSRDTDTNLNIPNNNNDSFLSGRKDSDNGPIKQEPEDSERISYGREENCESDDNDSDHLFYELDTSEKGQVSYLKALTDADAEIKIYLPLRDGGPEELKVSDVVSGTAAAGLECAEDAAFFPHAYNRMSRTPFATRRQKERSANIRKRKAEVSLRRSKDGRHTTTSSANSTSSAHNEKIHAAQISGLSTGKHTISTENPKATKNQIESSRALGSLVPKKSRTESSTKQKSGMAAGSGSNSLDAFVACNTGLFKRTTKKTSRRFSVAIGKSSLGNTGNAMPGDSYGKNEDWTKEEDENLIALASKFNNNMLLVADMLSMDKRVGVGIRKTRGVRHCIDRLRNVLAKETKTGPLVPKATSSDAKVFRKHEEALVKALQLAKQKPPVWSIPIANSIHPSQTKTLGEIAAHGLFSNRSQLPLLETVAGKIKAPPYHRSGLKPTETTPQAIHRLRYPFLKSPKDDLRVSPGRLAGSSPSRSSAPNNLRPFHSRPTAASNRGGVKGSRSSLQKTTSTGATSRANSSKAASTNQRPTVQSTTKSNVDSAVGKTQGPPSYPGVHRPGYVVPTTSTKVLTGQVTKGQNVVQGDSRGVGSEKKIANARSQSVSRNLLGRNMSQGVQNLQASQTLQSVQTNVGVTNNTFTKEKSAPLANTRKPTTATGATLPHKQVPTVPQLPVTESNGTVSTTNTSSSQLANGAPSTKGTKTSTSQSLNQAGLKTHSNVVGQRTSLGVDETVVQNTGLIPIVTTKKPPLPPASNPIGTCGKSVTVERRQTTTYGSSGKTMEAKPSSSVNAPNTKGDQKRDEKLVTSVQSSKDDKPPAKNPKVQK